MKKPVIVMLLIVAWALSSGCQATAPGSRRAFHEAQIEQVGAILRRRQARSAPNLRATTAYLEKQFAGHPAAADAALRYMLELD